MDYWDRYVKSMPGGTASRDRAKIKLIDRTIITIVEETHWKFPICPTCGINIVYKLLGEIVLKCAIGDGPWNVA